MDANASRRFPPTEGGVSGWLIVLACFIWQLIFACVEKGFGVLLLIFKRGFPSASADLLVGVGSVTLCLCDTSGAIVAGVINRGATPRGVIFVGSFFFLGGALASAFATTVPLLYLTYGVFIGVGAGLTYNASFIAMAQYFHRRLPFVTGITYLGGGLGGIVMPPLIAYLAEEFGRRGMLIVLAGILGQGFVMAALTRRIEENYPEKGMEKDGADKETERKIVSSDQKAFLNKPILSSTSPTEDASSSGECFVFGLNLSLFRDPVFLLYLLTQTISGPAGYWSPIYLPGMAVERGVDDMRAALLVSIEFGTLIAASLVFSVLLSLPSIRRHWRLIGVAHLFLLGVVDLAAPFLGAYWLYAVYAVFHGSLFIVSHLLRAPLLLDLMGRRHLESLLGINIFFKGLGFLAIPPIGGALLQRFRRHDAAFFFNAAVNVVAATSLATSCLLRSRKDAVLTQRSEDGADVDEDI